MSWLRSPLTPLLGLDTGSSEPQDEARSQSSRLSGRFASWTEGFFSPSPGSAEPIPEEGTGKITIPAVNRQTPCSCCPWPKGPAAGHRTNRSGDFLAHLPSRPEDMFHAHHRQPGPDITSLSSYVCRWAEVESSARLPELSSLKREEGFSQAVLEWATAVYSDMDQMDKTDTLPAMQLQTCMQRNERMSSAHV